MQRIILHPNRCRQQRRRLGLVLRAELTLLQAECAASGVEDAAAVAIHSWWRGHASRAWFKLELAAMLQPLKVRSERRPALLAAGRRLLVEHAAHRLGLNGAQSAIGVSDAAQREKKRLQARSPLTGALRKPRLKGLCCESRTEPFMVSWSSSSGLMPEPPPAPDEVLKPS